MALATVDAVSAISVTEIGNIAPLERTCAACQHRGLIIRWTATIVANQELLVQIRSLLETLSMLHC